MKIMEFDVEYREDWTRNDVRKYLIEDLLEDDTYEFYRDDSYLGFKSALYHFINENLSFETYEIDFKKADATRRAVIEITNRLDFVMEVEIWSLNTKDYTFKLEYNRKSLDNENITYITTPNDFNLARLDKFNQDQLNIFLNKLDKYLKDNNIDMSEY